MRPSLALQPSVAGFCKQRIRNSTTADASEAAAMFLSFMQGCHAQAAGARAVAPRYFPATSVL